MPHANRGIGRRDMLLLAGGAAAAATVTDGHRAYAAPGGDSPLPHGRPAGDARGARIDVHHHYTASSWVTWAAGKGLVEPAQLPWWTRWNLADTLALMDDAGIATSVLSLAMPVRRFTGPAQLQESVTVAFEAVTELKDSNPDRFAFFAPIFTDDLESSRRSFTRGLDELGALGVQTRASTNGVYLGDPSHSTLLAELNERSAVINTHPLELPGSDPTRPAVPGVPSFLCDFPLDTTRAAINLILNGTLDRYPDLSFILPHGGGFLPYIATRAEAFAGFLTPPVDPSRVRDYLHRFYYDTAAPLGPSSVATLLTVTDPSRLLYGSDWPASPAATITDIALPALDDDPTLTTRQRRHINRDNAVRLLPALDRRPTTPR
ncbi:amidohydrolase family protein [Streptomyces sp. NPDC005963]|uniref:amidohydrolase family protein n=1 Tax=Streptomyces sp. NPDC005963 TaxID=3156721 RepID=UPI0033EE5534